MRRSYSGYLPCNEDKITHFQNIPKVAHIILKERYELSEVSVQNDMPGLHKSKTGNFFTIDSRYVAVIVSTVFVSFEASLQEFKPPLR